ncbi:unnamed protein product [Protopolystoma xenopodis]|uniref:Integrase zinc-binding domain-containing protein n=1 Tax=Protopolystoma xenopodis TaxID=117903 RepID=A0A448WZF8_9PLAT|nr:unnamed protein product [Protopolystoma xenopodis]
MGKHRPSISSAMRKLVFQAVHDLAHPGLRASRILFTGRFVWLRMQTDIRKWTKACSICQENEVHRHTKAPIGSFERVPE